MTFKVGDIVQHKSHKHYEYLILAVGSELYFVRTCFYDGRSDYENAVSLQPELYELKPKIHVRYVNLYAESGKQTLYTSRKDADRNMSDTRKRIACVRVELKEGQFDD